MQTIATIFSEWEKNILDRTPPVRYAVGNGFESIPLEPKIVILVGAPPGWGKTALVMQWVFDAIRLQPHLKAVVCNVEMPPDALLTRELSRTSGVSLSVIQNRSYWENPDHVRRIETAIEEIERLLDRLTFVKPPFTLKRIAETVDQTEADMIVLDYIQRIKLTDDGSKDARQQATEAMDMVRQFANRGKAVIVVSSVARDKGSSGRAYANLSLGSYKESGELEFGGDSCYLLSKEDSADGAMTLLNPKSRYWQTQDVSLRFDGSHQRFVATGAMARGSNAV